MILSREKKVEKEEWKEGVGWCSEYLVNIYIVLMSGIMKKTAKHDDDVLTSKVANNSSHLTL